MKHKRKNKVGYLIAFVVFAIAIIIPVSFAKLRTSESITIATGSITYTPADLSILAIYLESSSGSGVYTTSSTVPSTGYTLSSDTYCEVGGTKDDSVVVVYSNGEVSVNNITTKGTKCYLYFDVSSSDSLASYLVALGDSSLIEHSSTCSNGCAKDNLYRYSGASSDVNNYICFGTSNTSTCLADTDTYLFRIVEVDPNTGYVKIVKNSSYTTTSWNASSVSYNSKSNYWAVGSTLYAALATTLNTTYLNTFDSSWKSLIVNYNWHIAGASSSYTGYSVKDLYDSESSSTAVFKIGLINAYDYGYAAESSYWSSGVYNYSNDAYLEDWLYLGTDEWSITRNTDSSNYALNIASSGDVYGSSDVTSTSLSIRPAFYISSNASYVSGSGTESSPIIIN